MQMHGAVSEPAGLSMAKWLVDRGAKVIPAYVSMKTGDKMPLVKDWANVGTREVDVLNRWWDEKGYAWPGVVSGRNSWLCFDVDGESALEWFRTFYTNNGGPGKSGMGEDGECGPLLYYTPGRNRGLHVWFRWPEWLSELHSVKYSEPGWNGEVQLRGRGCWTLMAGCKRPDGEYQVLSTPDVLCEAPRELIVAFMAAGNQVAVAGSTDLRELSVDDAWAGAPWQDNRKQAVAGLAWYLSIRGASEDEVLRICTQFAVDCCDPVLDLNIVNRKVSYTWQRANAARERVAAEAAAYSKWMKI